MSDAPLTPPIKNRAAYRVHKLDANGHPVWHYDGAILARGPRFIWLEAYFMRPDYVADYHTFQHGDRMLEWFYSDRWYNIFQMHAADDGRLRGWYCNITRPARLERYALYAEDLALDLMVYPDGRYQILDADEFDALDLDATTRQQAQAALDALIKQAQGAEGVFKQIRA